MNKSTAPRVHSLQCFEIWGSNKRVNDAISVPGITVWIHSSPFADNNQGGDIHFVSMCGAGRVSRFALADVSGHGELAGHVADRLRKLMRKHIHTLDQTRFARALNREFSELAKFGSFATALLTTYFAPTDHLIICNAGHPKPFLYCARTKTWKLLDENIDDPAEPVANIPFGVIEPTDYVQFAVGLELGDVVVMYTDSLIEARNPDGNQLGEKGLLELIKKLDLDEIHTLTERIINKIADYRGLAPAEDDQTLLVLHHDASDPPRLSFGETAKVMAKMIGLVRV